MIEEKYFLVQIKHTSGVWERGGRVMITQDDLDAFVNELLEEQGRES